MEKMWSQLQKEGLLKRYKSLTWLPAFVDYYVDAVQSQGYHSYLEAFAQLEKGLDPIPNREEHKDLLTELGHDEGMLVLPPHSLLKNFLLGLMVYRENYMALHSVCVSRLMTHYSTPFSRETIRRLHGLLDRLLFGGSKFATIEAVPTIGRWFWHGVKRVKFEPGALGTSISLVRKRKACEQFCSRTAERVGSIESSALDLLSASCAFRHGRRWANYDDVWDAATALTELFHVDVTKLEPPRRVPPPAEAAAASR